MANSHDPYADVAEERARQLRRWNAEHDDAHWPTDWMTLLTRQIGDAAEHAIEDRLWWPDGSGYTRDGLHPCLYRAALVRAAAVAIAAIEAFDRRMLDEIPELESKER